MPDADATLRTEVLTPEGRTFSGDLFHVSVRTVIGELGIRARHTPVLARLVPHELRLYESEADFDAASTGGGERFVVAEGWLEVFANKVIVLVGEAMRPDALDVETMKARLADAEQRLGEAEEGSAAYRVAERDKERAEAFLRIAGVLAEREPERAKALAQLTED